MKIAEFDYDLPPEKIAIYPPTIRGDAKLMVVNRQTQGINHRKYFDLGEYINPGDLIILNNTKVIKARLITHKINGAKIELLLEEKHHPLIDLNSQKAIYRGNIEIGDHLLIGKYQIIVKSIEKEGEVTISCEKNLYELTEEFGEVPIPPYLKRKSEDIDKIRYQTVFAKEDGSVAAPTASLNFTDGLKHKLETKGVNVVFITLHVGLGTFLPIREIEVEKHQIHSEYFIINQNVVDQIRQVKLSNHKIVAIGTTVSRALEAASALILKRSFQGDISQEAQIYIYPSYEFKIVDHLVTNFHAPRSTVLLLASAFVGTDLLKKAYQEAITQDYKFLSYGDSMLIL